FPDGVPQRRDAFLRVADRAESFDRHRLGNRHALERAEAVLHGADAQLGKPFRVGRRGLVAILHAAAAEAAVQAPEIGDRPSPQPMRPGWSVTTLTKIQLRIRAWHTRVSIFAIFIGVTTETRRKTRPRRIPLCTSPLPPRGVGGRTRREVFSVASSFSVSLWF